MNITSLFPTHKVVEINLSTGLRTGHMLAQHAYKDAVNAYLDNGCFFRMSKAAADEVVLADNANAIGPYFLHYTEELLTNGIVDAYKYFAVELEDGVCYPRCIALYAGDTFTTDNYTGTLSGCKFAIVGTNGVVELKSSLPTTISGGYTGPLFQAVASTLPDGSAAVQLTVIDPAYTIAAGH